MQQRRGPADALVCVFAAVESVRSDVTGLSEDFGLERPCRRQEIAGLRSLLKAFTAATSGHGTTRRRRREPPTGGGAARQAADSHLRADHFSPAPSEGSHADGDGCMPPPGPLGGRPEASGAEKDGDVPFPGRRPAGDGEAFPSKQSQDDRLLKVEAVLRISDADGDGRLNLRELAGLWASVNSGSLLEAATYVGACGLVGAEPQMGARCAAAFPPLCQGPRGSGRALRRAARWPPWAATASETSWQASR